MAQGLNYNRKKKAKWTGWVKKTAKSGLVVVSTEFNGNIREYGYAVFNNKNNPNFIDELDKKWKVLKDKIVQVELSDGTKSPDGNWPSQVLCWSLTDTRDIPPAGDDLDDDDMPF